ncbi:PTS sugar transporter subunit IIA [Novosphingobium colocasiae]|uniref:PTS sugar transporter subunit IIA n=1 Tax=Novosphingobium colocasiae TaxID=1256513 RepID=UPI0035AEBC7D
MSSLFTLLPDAVAIDSADSKNAILDRLSGLFAEVYQLDRKAVLARIVEREQLGSTGFGRSIAIPHARLPGLSRPVAAFIRLAAPVEFDAADNMPIDLVFGLLSPEGAGATHLHALAAISRLMRDDRMHAALLAAPGQEALFSLLSNSIDRDAA